MVMMRMRVRNVQVSLVCISRLVCQACRLSLGSLMPMIAQELMLSTAQKASLLAAFPLGYLITQVPGGTASDRFGAKPVLSATLLGTALGALAVAQFSSFVALWITVLLMGLLQGPLFPTNGCVLSSWVPSCDRAFATAVAELGNPLGALCALFFSPILADTFGWRTTLVIEGLITLAFAMAWQVLGANNPESCPYLPSSEREELRRLGVKVGGGGGGGDGLPARGPSARITDQSAAWGSLLAPLRVLTVPSAWAVLLANVAFNFNRYLAYTWVPLYYTAAWGTPVAEAARRAVWPNIADMGCAVLAGHLADAISGSGVISVLSTRRLFSGMGFLGTGLGMYFAGTSANVEAVTVWLTISAGMQACHTAGFKSSYTEISRASAGTFMGIGNTAASIAPFLVPWVGTAVLEARGGQEAPAAWQLLFMVALAVSFAGAAIFVGLISSRTIDETLQERAALKKAAPLCRSAAEAQCSSYSRGRYRQRQRSRTSLIALIVSVLFAFQGAALGLGFGRSG